jgi:hypothetical protein
MVKYTCEICNTNYLAFNEAEECEKKGIIGPEIKPGLLLSHKKVDDGFLLFYNEADPKGHEKVYHLEEITSNNTLTYSLQDFTIPNSKLKNWLENYKVSTKEEVDRLNKLIQEKAMGTEVIKVYLGRFNIEKLHNKVNLESLNFNL